MTNRNEVYRAMLDSLVDSFEVAGVTGKIVVSMNHADIADMLHQVRRAIPQSAQIGAKGNADLSQVLRLAALMLESANLLTGGNLATSAIFGGGKRYAGAELIELLRLYSDEVLQ